MFAGADNRVAVVASAQTHLKENWGNRQHVDLISEAVAAALKGSGLRIEDIDFVIDSGSDVLDGRSISNCGFLGAMGAHHKEESRVEEDGLWAALYGATKIASGSAEAGLLIAYSKPSEGDVSAYWWSQLEPFYQRPVGFGQEAAGGLQAQSYLAKHRLSDEIFGDVVAAEWAKADANPWVETREAPDAAAVKASPAVAAPLRQLEMARPLDGAVAVVIASARLAARNPDPVWITGIGTAMDQHAFVRRERASLPAAKVAAEAAYRRAKIDDPTKLSIAEVSASSAATQLMVLEALGLAEEGSGASLYRDGTGVAINPSGGALPADPIMATGLVRLHEAAQQLAGRVDHAPAGATTAVVHGAGGVGMQNHCVFTLEV
ncbi:MAG TPA: hypothetical protein VHA80_12395 [Solirubrobacterales bacterium]|nr:hypothetical protein [Solirubrobacterales bacterium]